MVDFATVAEQMVFTKKIQIVHVMILFHSLSRIQGKSNEKCNAFCHVQNNLLLKNNSVL
jgi:hypothetical protein